MRVPVDPPEGVKEPSVILCDQVRTISLDRIGNKWGEVSPKTMEIVEDRVKVFLHLR